MPRKTNRKTPPMNTTSHAYEIRVRANVRRLVIAALGLAPEAPGPENRYVGTTGEFLADLRAAGGAALADRIEANEAAVLAAWNAAQLDRVFARCAAAY